MRKAALIPTNKEELNILLSISIFFSVVILCIGLLMMGYIVIRHLFFLEEICGQKAEKTVGRDWNRLVLASPADREHHRQFVDSNNKIRWGMQEELRCEDEDKPFLFF
jgi:hypothetical protein